jgi:hypothetical protein
MALWIKYIDAIPWTPGELDHQEFAALNKAAFYGINQDTALNFVVDKMKRAGAQNLRLAKIRHSLLRAYGSGGEGSHQLPPLKLPPIEPYNEALLRKEVGEFADKVDETFFIERSLFTTWNRTPAGVLHKLCLPGECVWVTADDCSADGCLWTHLNGNNCSARWISVTGAPGGPEEFEPNFACLSFFQRNHHKGVWFLNNPVTGQPHYDGRLSHGMSYRCLETVSSWRYLVLETDVAPTALWLGLLAIVPIRISAICFSGRRGHHALVQINAQSKLQADDIAEIYKREYAPLGACTGTLSPFRLTRLPNCFRAQTGQWQRLIYLSSNPTGTPIKDQPVLRKVPPAHEDGTGT